MKSIGINKIAVVLLFLLTVATAYSQGNFKYHYVVPPDLGERMSGIKKIAFLDIKYTAPVSERDANKKEEYDAGDELVKVMVEKEKKELLGEEEYNKLKAAERSGTYSNSMGGALVSNITSILLIPNRGQIPGFKFLLEGIKTDPYIIVDRATIDKVLIEQQFQLSGVVDGQEMAEIGVLMGADAIITGNMVSTKNDQRLPEKIKKHYKTVKYIDDDGKEKSKSVFDYNEYVYTIQRTVTSNFDMQVVSVETGAILGTKTFTKTAVDKKSRSFKRSKPSSGQYPPYSELATTDFLVRKTVNPLSQEAANLIAPRFATIKMGISKVKAKEFKKIAKEASDYLKDGKVEKAFAIYKTIYDADPYITESAFNLGMIYEATGQYKKAQEYYEAALESAVKNSNEKKYDKAVERAKNGIIVMSQLEANGIVLEKQFFSDDAAESLMAAKVHTKGNPKKDRFSVYAKADASSEIIGKVPGGRDFPSFKVEGEWTLIEIIGGKKGYIRNENLK
jgi:hypothetical protein